MAHRLLLIEDDTDAASIIVGALQAEGFDVEWEQSADGGLTAAARGGHALILLDRMLGDADGLEVLRAVRRIGAVVPVLVLSALSRSDNRTEGLETGADDYLGKPFDRRELVARVRALIRRTTAQPHGAVMLFGELELHVKSRVAYRAGKLLDLTPKEYDILTLLMTHAGETVTREMLLREVWNLNFDPQTSVIDVNMSRLRGQLNQGFDGNVLETVRGVGFRLVGP
jgi:two-component system OmpR family response regulator